MATWTNDELRTVAASEELELASVHADDRLGNPVTIWGVRVGNDLYVRSWKGEGGAWFRATQKRHAGHIEAGGIGKDLTFVAETDDDVNDRIDAAYRTKYRRHGGHYVDPMVAASGARHDDQARAAFTGHARFSGPPRASNRDQPWESRVSIPGSSSRVTC